MTNYREQYKRLLSEFERLGGNLQGVPRFYSLENEAKLKAKLKSLTPRSPLSESEGDNPKSVTSSTSVLPLSSGEVVGNCRVSEKGVRTPEPDLMVLAEEVGGSLRVRFSKGVWYLYFTFFGKKVESAAPTLTEAINGLIINKHLNK